jgi:pimeloyl-ACP methyl ester carboxylesterase
MRAQSVIAVTLIAAVLALQAACSPVRFQENRIENKFHRHGLSEHTLETENAVIHYWKGGEGSPVFLLHGFGANGLWTWHPQIDALTEEHQLIIPDLIWFGDSYAKEAAYSLDFQAESFLALLAHEEITKVDLVGISYGGLVVFNMAVAAPELVDRFVMVDSPGPVFTAQDHAEMLERMGVESTADIVIPDSAEDLPKLFRLAYHRPPKLPRFLLNDTYNQLFTKYVPEKRALLAFLEHNQARLTTVAWELPHDTLILWGEKDPLFTPEIGQRLARKIGDNAKFAVIAEASHAPNIEQPKSFNILLSTFLSRAD